MEEKIRPQDSAKLTNIMRGVENGTDRLIKGIQETSEKEKRTGSIGLDDLERQKLIEQYILQKNKSLFEQENIQKNNTARNESLAIPEKLLDKLSDGMELLEESVKELPAVQDSDAENLAITEINKSVDLIEAAEKLEGKIQDHFLKKRAIEEELERGFEIGESLRQLEGNGQEVKEHILHKNKKTVRKIEKRAEKRNQSESRKLKKDIEKLDRKYDQKIMQTDSTKKAKELYEKKVRKQLKADKKHTKKLSKKTNRAAYKQIKKHGGVDSAAMTAMVSQAAMDNRINKKAYKRETAKNIKGISNGSNSSRLEKTLKIRAGNIGENNRHIHLTNSTSRRGERSTRILKKDGGQEGTEKFIKKQEKEAEKRAGQLAKKKQNRTRKIENKAMIRKAKMNFMIQTLLSDEKNSNKTAGLELMKQIFTIKSSSIIKRAAGKAGHMLFALIIGIVQFFITVLLSIGSLFITCLFPVILVGVCVLTIYSAIAYIGGFFNIGDGGVLTVAETEINLMDKANKLYNDFSSQISSYKNRSRVVKNTETEYIEETYTVTYPYQESPAKGDFLTSYFTMISEEQESNLTDGGDILPYLNINTAVENNMLNQVFGQMNYFGTETYSETSRRELIGYEKKKITEQVLTGYQSTVESHSVPADSFIYDYGTAAGNSSNIYLGVDMTDSYEDYIQLSDDLISEGRMYCYLYTTSNNKIPLGCELSLDVTYKNSQNEDVPVTLKVQVVGIDTAGKNLYRNSPHIKLFGRTVTKLGTGDVLQAYMLVLYRKTKGIERFGNLKSQTAYTYETIKQVPVYETRERYVDDMDKPVYRTYTYKKYNKPVYYLSAAMWYSMYSSSLSEKQRETYQECVDLYHDKTY